MLAVVSEILLYLSFSLLWGGLLVQVIPADRRPEITVPRRLLWGTPVLIAVFSFGPVWQVIQTFGADIGWASTAKEVVFDFQIGKAWLLTLGISLFLAVFLGVNDVRNHPLFARVAIGWAFILVFCLGWASHAASFYPMGGFLAHSVHFLAVCGWSGVLLMVGWFAKDSERWERFLGWFTPFAILCVSVIIGAGLVLMNYIVPEYWNSWLLTYGQALLVKHLLILPLLFLAGINGFLTRKRLRANPGYNPIPWVKEESLLLVLVFSATAFLGQQSPGSPPHKVSAAIREIGPSPLNQTLGVPVDLPVTLTGNPLVFLLGTLSLLFLASIVLTFRRKRSPYWTVGMGAGFAIAAFLTVLSAIR